MLSGLRSFESSSKENETGRRKSIVWEKSRHSKRFTDANSVRCSRADGDAIRQFVIILLGCQQGFLQCFLQEPPTCCRAGCWCDLSLHPSLDELIHGTLNFKGVCLSCWAEEPSFYSRTVDVACSHASLACFIVIIEGLGYDRCLDDGFCEPCGEVEMQAAHCGATGYLGERPVGILGWYLF